jgi:hypothetical protein
MAVVVANQGGEAIVNPYLLGSIFGDLGTGTYLWICITSTCILLGITCTLIYRKQPPDPEIVKMFLKVGGNLAALRKAQEASVTEVAEQIDYGRKVNQKFLNKINTDLDERGKETLGLLASQKRMIKKVRTETISLIEKKTDEIGRQMSADLKKERADLKEIKDGFKRMEASMLPVQTKLNSLSKPEDIKGIGPSLGKDLRGLGINSVGDFLITEPSVIGEKTRVSQEMAENLQSMGQLLMVPGIDANDAEMLLEAGIKSRKELASQDLIKLCRKVSKIAKVYLVQGKITKEECPSIEEISFWIRNA